MKFLANIKKNNNNITTITTVLRPIHRSTRGH